MKDNTSQLFETQLITIRNQLNSDLEQLNECEHRIKQAISRSEEKDEIKSTLKNSKNKIKRQISAINKALIQII